jgi:hypothetical protein
MGDAVVLVPGGAALRTCPPAARVDVDAAHQREVDHQSAVGDGPADHVVPAAANRDLQPCIAAERDSVAHVGDIAAAGNQAGTPVN